MKLDPSSLKTLTDAPQRPYVLRENILQSQSFKFHRVIFSGAQI